MEQVLDGEFPEFAIAHEFSKNLFIAFHTVDHEALEGFLEDVAEVVLGIRGGSFLQCLAFDGFFLNLVEEELIGLSKVSAEALVQDVDQFGELDQFQTHEHSKYIESRYSGADLGILLAIDHPLFGRSCRGILVQAKRLFGKGKSREFSLFSDYNSFDKRQADFLKTLEKRFGVWNSVYYLWYNPPSTSFSEKESKILRAYDAAGSTLYPHWHRMHPFIDELIDSGFPWLFSGNPRAVPSTEDESRAREWRATQPALRVSDLDVVLSVAEHGPPKLKALYDAALERRSMHTFSPFADFFLLALASSRVGSDQPDWLKLTEGQKVAMPAPKQPNERRDDVDQLDSPPIPRHTLRITVRSTLPPIG